jgi:hypothetical protein
MELGYSKLNKEDFDAIVTGEVTHYALWLEEELNGIIADYFVSNDLRRDEFKRFLLYRDGLTFQDKIEIVGGMIPLFGSAAEKVGLKSTLREIEEFKSWRNALAHGLDITDDKGSAYIRVEVITRSGKEKVIEITPESHEEMMRKTEKLLLRIQKARKKLNAKKIDGASPRK